MNKDIEWRIAYAKQALSDCNMYELLCRNSNVEVCHRLLYIQMFLEKASKAYLWKSTDSTSGIPSFHVTHNVIVKVIPQIIKFYSGASKEQIAINRNKMNEIRKICREIDLLCPSVDDDGRRPDNCEYPWASSSGDKVCIPCEEKFEIQNRLLNSSNGILIIKAAKYACTKLSK